MKNLIATINPTQTLNPNNITFKVSRFMVIMALAMIGVAFLAINGLKYGIAYLFFLPIIHKMYTEVKSIMSLDFDFTLDNDMMTEIHEDLWARS